MPTSRPGPEPTFDVGDRVYAAEDLGGFFWPKVPAGTFGIVIGHEIDGAITVLFANERTLAVWPEQLTR
jgi:hypothetical protein